MVEEQKIVVLDNKNLTIHNPKSKIELPKYWDKDYINYKIELIKNYHYKMLIIFLWYSGVRITEALNIKKQDIDFEHYTVVLTWLKSRKYTHRVIPLHPELKSLLQMYTATNNMIDRVFPITRQRAWQIVKKCLNGHPHQLRHSFAVNWLRSGGNIYSLYKILGHSKIQTTMIYLNIVPSDLGKELLKISFR